MSLSPAKHYYSKTSVEAWFRRLTRDWEGHFSSDQLKKGREIYLSNGIREIELNVDDAIVHANLNDRVYYSVISWSRIGPAIRCSSRNRDRGHAIAVAGLYQIEELIADQLSELSIGELGMENSVSPDDGWNDDDGDDSESESEDFPMRHRPLVLTFKGTEEGLGFEACWLNPDGKSESALSFENEPNTPLSESESESLIRLTSLARKSGFSLDKPKRRFLMQDIGRFIPFLSHELPKWRSHFTIVRETEVKRLMQGVQSVEVEASVREAHPDREHSYEIEWSYRTAGKTLTEQEATRLASRRGQPVFLPKRGIVQLTDSQVHLLDRWNQFRKEARSHPMERYMILSLFGDTGQALKLSRNLLNWRKRLFSEPKTVPVKIPELREYQIKGIQWMLHVLHHDCHCLLADEMGLGKTVQVLGVIHQLHQHDKRASIVFCPASVIPVWKSEVARFFPSMRVLQVTGQRSLAEVDWSGVDLVVCSYTQLRRNLEALRNVEYLCCVLDEAQVIKNPDTKVSRSAYAIRAKHRIAVTGTPIENHFKDVWSLFFFLMPGLLGSRTRFQTMLEKAGEGFALRLRNQLAPFILRRVKEEVTTELPDKNEMQLNCSMTDVQKKEYNRLVNDGLHRLTSASGETLQKRTFSFFALLTRLRQVCCDPGLLPWMDVDPSKSAKIQLLVEKLADIYEAGHRVVIFSQFVGLIDRVKIVLEREFPNLNLFVLTGKTVDRAKPVCQFQESDHPATILVSLKAGGTGITLHAADYVFLLDPWWNPSVEAQAIDRVHRLGQENPVFVYRVIATGTIEERVQALQHEKREMFRELIENLSDVSQHKAHWNSLKDLISLQN